MNNGKKEQKKIKLIKINITRIGKVILNLLLNTSPIQLIFADDAGICAT